MGFSLIEPRSGKAYEKTSSNQGATAMKEIVTFIEKIERMAGDLYRKASTFFQEDKEFAGFLNTLAEDEDYHLEVMTKADEYLKGRVRETSAFISLFSAKEKIEGPLKRANQMLVDGTLSKEDMIECIVTAESSEWNDVFLYIVDTLKDRHRDFQGVAAKIQEHKRQIETFVETMPDGGKYAEQLQGLPAVWEETILVVEDESAIVELLEAVLSREGIVESAQNGKEALDKLRDRHFDVILSDVNMPVMDGIKFFHEALKLDNEIGERFLFFTGFTTSEDLDFFEKNNLRYMVKPADLGQILQIVRELLGRKSAAE